LGGYRSGQPGQTATARGRGAARGGINLQRTMFIVYILYSSKSCKHYVGHTEDIESRLALHNAGKVRSTKSGVPWVVKYIEKFDNRNDAYRRELQIKKFKSGRAFIKLINR
jgi:putative endonuclease